MSGKLKSFEPLETEQGTFPQAKGADEAAARLRASLPNEAAQAQHQVFRTATKYAEEWVSLGQGNFDAILKSSQIWAAGVQDLAKQFAASAQSSFDESLATFKALSSVKSPQEALDLQTTLARTVLDKTLAETGRIGDASLKLFEQTLAPIAARATLTVEKFGKSVV
jgi:phasin family protein